MFYYLNERQFHWLLYQTAINKIMRENKSKTEKLDKLKIDKCLTEKYLKLDSQFPRTEPFKNDEK